MIELRQNYTKGDEAANKRCGRCKRVKKISEFVRNRSSNDGHSGRCKECHRSMSKSSDAKNKESRIATTKRYNDGHRDLIRMRTGRWAKNNPEKLKAIKARYRKNNPQADIEYRKNFGHQCQIKMRNLYPEKYKSRCKLSNAIRSGKVQRAKEMKCVGCGKQADEWHHHKGYSVEFALDVIAVCKPCHVIEDKKQ